MYLKTTKDLEINYICFNRYKSNSKYHNKNIFDLNNKLFKGYLWICTRLTFSFSVPSSFLSSLFFSFPGASAMGSEVWNMYSFPLRSADLSASSPACMTGPSTVSVSRDSENISGIWDNRLSMTASDSDSFTRNPSSNGTNTSLKSDTTNIWGWARFPYNHKTILW